MQLHYDEETEAFRAELRAWLASNAPDPAEVKAAPSRSSAHIPAWARAWQQRLFDAGWLVPGWPPELGGRNATAVQQLVYFEELARIDVRRSYNIQGLTIIVPSIRDFGNDEQKARFLVPSLRGEVAWCLGMSEPGAGSDLAGLSTRAVDRGDHFEVTGQKVWTSGASHADYCFCFVRTNTEVPKHKGISVLIIDLASEGVSVRPLPNLVEPDDLDFNEVFFDAVKVPRENLVGALDQGWSMAAGSLAHERGMLWTSQTSRLEAQLDSLKRRADRPGPDGGRIGDDPIFRDAFASLYVDVQCLKFMGYSGFGKISQGQAAPEHSVLKLAGSEVAQRLALVAGEAEGTAALDFTWESELGTWGDLENVPWLHAYLFSFSNTIAGGTSEIQRNIIAQRVLGLPRR